MQLTSAISPRWAAAGGALPARWRLRLLGGFELDDGFGARIERLPSRAITLLLARLALEPARAHGREELIDLLWPDVGLEVGRNRLRQALSALRSVLEPREAPPAPVLLADRRTVRLAPGALSCDVDALRAALVQGDRQAAARIYTGELLPGFFDEWVIDARRVLANHAEGLAPLLAPASAFVAESTPQPFEPPRPRLPSYLTSLFGFEEAAGALAASVRAQRLVTLRGPGGAGKTRLAVEVARMFAESPAESATEGAADARRAPGFELVVFVALAACTTPEAMCDAVLRAFRHEGGAAPRAAATPAEQRVARIELALAGRSALLVLDNFEQLVEAGRADVALWLAHLPRLHLLMTSRRALALDGETEFVLSSLPLPIPGLELGENACNPAVGLFAARARAARADFHLSERNHALVVAIVRQLHGLPLAIELAAARVRSVSLAELLVLLEGAAQQAPGRALALLARAGSHGADDARHASMLRVIEWSWLRLNAAERALLGALSVFDGGAGLPAAAAVAGEDQAVVAALLDELVASSVAYTGEGHAGTARYQPFEPVREYALMNLDAVDIARLRAAHLRWARGWAAALGRSPTLDIFREELPNLLAALAEAARQGDAAGALDMLLDAAYALDDVNLPPSALALLRRLLDGDALPDPTRAARGHAILASQSFEAGERAYAEQHAERALELVDRTQPRAADVLRSAARVLLRTRGDAADIEPLLDSALQSARRHGEHDIEARTLSLLAVLALQRAHGAACSLALKREALALWQAHGPSARVTEGLVNLALGLGSSRAAQEQLELLGQARRSALAHGQMRLLAFVLSVTGHALADERQWEASAACYADCLRTAWEAGLWREWFYGLWNLPRTLAHQRRPQAAASLMGFAEAFYADRFGTLGWSDCREARRTRRLVRRQLGAPREAALWSEGRAMSADAAMRLALREAAPPDASATAWRPLSAGG